jgi:peptidoglycan hydrolase-like protein with peptidoglycan-binding domain
LFHAQVHACREQETLKNLKTRIAVSMAACAAVMAPLVISTPATAAPSGCVARVFQSKSTGDCVKNIQAILNYDEFRNSRPKITVDGSFGPATDWSVRQFQGDWWVTSDGIVGSSTWGLLCSHRQGSMTPVQTRAGCGSLF